MSVPSRFYLFRRNNKIYYIGSWPDSRKRWKPTHCKTKHEALKSLALFRDLFTTKPVVILLSVFMREFVLYAEATYQPKTVELYDRSLRQLLSLTVDIPVSSVTQEQVDGCKATRSSSPVSVSMELRALRSVFNTALK